MPCCMRTRPALVAFSIVRKLPDLDLIPSVRHICEQMKIAKYAIPGSEALGAEIGKVFAQGCDAALLENHGVCIGRAGYVHGIPAL